MERVGDMTREELRQLVSEVVEEMLERAIRENGAARVLRNPGPEGADRRQILEEIRRESRKLKRPSGPWSNPVIEEREAIRNWKPTRELRGHEWITEERRLRGSGSQE